MFRPCKRCSLHSPELHFALTFQGRALHFALIPLQFALTPERARRCTSHSLGRGIGRARHGDKGTAPDGRRRAFEHKKVILELDAEAGVNPSHRAQIFTETVLEEPKLRHIGGEHRLKRGKPHAHLAARRNHRGAIGEPGIDVHPAG